MIQEEEEERKLHTMGYSSSTSQETNALDQTSPRNLPLVEEMEKRGAGSDGRDGENGGYGPTHTEPAMWMCAGCGYDLNTYDDLTCNQCKEENTECWVCPLCEFEVNSTHSLSCEMCNLPRLSNNQWDTLLGSTLGTTNSTETSSRSSTQNVHSPRIHKSNLTKFESAFDNSMDYSEDYLIEVTHLREGKKEDFISPIIKTQSVFRTAQLNSAMNGANIHDSHEAAGTRDDNEAKKKQLISFVGLTRAMIMAQMLEAGIDLENVDDQVQLTQFRRKGMSEKKTESKRTSLYNIGVLGIAKSTTGLKASDKHTKKKGRKRRRKRSKSDYKSLLTKAEMQRGTPRHSSFQTKKDVNEVKRVGDKKNIHRGLNIVRELRQTVDKEVLESSSSSESGSETKVQRVNNNASGKLWYKGPGSATSRFSSNRSLRAKSRARLSSMDDLKHSRRFKHWRYGGLYVLDTGSSVNASRCFSSKRKDGHSLLDDIIKSSDVETMLRKVSKEYDKMNYDMRADIERHTHHPRQEFQVDLSDNEDEAKADKIGDLLKEEAQQVTEAQWTTERVASWVSQLLTDHTRQRSTAIFLGFADMSTSTRGKMIIATYKNILVATIAQKLMTSIKDDKELIQHCTFVLANLCSEPSIRERLLTMGVVDTFISMVLKRKELNLATLRSVGYGLAACSLSVDAHSTFRSPQVLEGILELVDGVDTAVQFFGLVVIRNLSAYAKNWAPLLLQGVFNSLLSTMKAPDVLETTALMCAQVFQSLVANDHVKILVGTRTYLSTIAHEMTQTSNVVREELAALVSCISQVDATHINITDTDVIRPLLRCLSKKTSLGTHFHIAQVLANLSGNASTHTVFLEHGMLRRVLQLIYSLDEDIRLAAIRCVANLSNTAPLHPNLIQRGFLLCLPMYMINKDEPACRLFASLFAAIMSIRPESLKALQDVPRLISVLIYLVFYSSESLRHRDLIRNVTLTLANLSADPQLHPIMLKEINRLSDDRFARVFELRDIPSVESFILFLANLSSSKNTHHALASPTVLRKVTPYLDIEKMIRIKEMHHNHFREKVREERRKEDEQLESAELARKEEHNKAMALRKAKQELELATSNQLERDILDVTLEKSSPGERDALKKAFEEKQSLRQLELKKEAKAELAEEQRREAARLDAADARRKARQEADEEDQRAFEKELHDSILIQRRITHLCLLFLYNVCSSHRTRELVAKESLFVICFLLQALDGHDLVLAAELLNEISSLESVKVRLFTEPEMHTFVSTFKSLLRSDLVDVRGHALTAIARSCTAQTVHHNLVQSDVLDLLLQGLYSKIKEIQLTSLHALCFLSANPDEQVSLMLQKKRICETYLSHITSNSVFTECRQLAYIILGQLAQHREFHVDFARKMPVAFLHIEEDTKENLLDCIVTILENHGRRRKRYKPKGEAIVNVEGDDAYMHRLASPRKSVLTEYLESFQICNGISFATRTELLRNIEQKKDSTMTEIDGAPATLREGAKNEKEITINDSNRSTSQTKDIRLTNAKELECALFAVMNLCMHRYLHHLIVERCGPLLIRLTLDWFEHSDATFRRVLTMLLRNISSTNEGYPAFRDFKPSLLPLFQLAEVEMRIETMNNILCCFRNIAMHELSSRSVARSKAVTTIITHILIKYSNIEDEVGSAHKLWKKVEALKNTADHCSSRAMIAQKRREVFSLAVEDAETNVQYEEANRQELFKRILHQKLVLKSILKRETIHLLYHASLFRHSLALITYNTHFLSLAAQLLPLYRTSPEASRKGAWILANIGTNLETRELAIKHSVLQILFNFLLEEADSTIAEQPEDTDASLQNGPMSAKAFNDINAHKLREEGYGMSSSKDNKNKPASSSGGKTRKLWGRIKRDIDEQAHSKSLAKRLAELIINAAGNENINFTLYCTLLEPLPHVYYEIMRSSESRALLMTQVGCDELFEWTNALLSAPYHIWHLSAVYGLCMTSLTRRYRGLRNRFWASFESMPWSILPKLQRFVIDGFIDHQKVEKERKKALQRWENSMMAAEDEFYREKLTFAEEKENQARLHLLAREKLRKRKFVHRLGRIRERAKFEQFIAARLENWRAQWVEEDVAAEKAFKAMDRELKEKEYHWQWKLERRHQKYTLRQKKLQERMRKIQKDIGEDFDTEAFEKANETLRMRRRNSDGRVEVESILHQQEIINRKEEFAAGERERKERQLMALAEHDSDKEWFRIKQMIDLITKYGRFTSERLRIKIERKHMIAALERREKEMQMQHEQEKLDLQTKTRLAERRENKWPKYLLDTDAKRRERQRNIEYFQNIQTRHKLSILSLSTLANFTYETQPDDRRVLLSQYAPILNRIHDLIDVAAKYGYPLILRQVSTMLVNLVSDPTDMSGSSATSYRYGRGLAEKKKNALFDSAEDIEYEQEWEATIELGLSTVGEAIEISRLNTLLCCDDAQTKVIAMLLLKRLTTRKEFAYRLAFCSPIMHLLCNLVEDPASDSILCGHIAGVLMHISNHGSSLSRYLVRPDIIAILGILAEMDYEGMRAKSVPEEEESISHRAYSLSRRQSSSRSSMSSIHGLHIEDEGTTMDDFRADGGKISFKRESMNNRRDRIYSTTKVALSLISHHPVAMASQSAGVKIVFDTLMKASFYLLSIVEPTATQEMFEEDVLENEDENESNWQNLDQFTRIGSESETRFTDIVAKSIEGAVLGSDLCNGEQLHLSAANTILMKDQVVSRMKRYAKVIQSYRKTSLLCPVPEMGREEKQVEIRFYLSLLMGTVQGVAHLMHFHSIQSIIKAVGADLILPIFLLVAPLDPLKNLNSVVPSPRDAALNYHPSRLLEDPIGVFRHSLAVFPLKGYEGWRHFLAELSDEHLTSSDAIMYHTSIMAENLVKILITPAERNDMLARELLFLIIKLCSVPHTSHGDEIDKRDNYYYNFEHDLKAGPKTLSSTSSQSIVLHSAALIDATKRKQGRYQSATQNRKEHGHKRTVSFVPVVLINKARRKLMRLGGKDNHDENKIGAICAQAIPNISMVSSSGTAPVVERVKRHRGSFFLSTDAVKGDISNKALDVLHSYALYKIKSPGQSSVDHGTIEIESSFSNVRVETNLVTVKIKIFIEGTVDISIDVPHPSLNIPANAIEEKNDDSSKDVRKTDALPLNGPKRRRAVGRGAIFDSAGTNTSDAPPALPDEPPNTYIPSDRSTEIRASGIKMFIQLLNATSDSVRVVVDNSDLQCCMSAALINIFLLRCVEDPRRLELDRSIFDRINSNATSVEARQDILDASVAWLNKSYLPVNTKLAIQTNFDALRSLGKLSTNNSYMKYIAEKHRHVVVVLLGMAKLPEMQPGTMGFVLLLGLLSRMSEYPQLLRFFATNASIRVLSVFSSAPSALNVIDDAVGDASEGVVREMGISRDDREEISSLAHLHACIIVSRLATHAAASRNTARNVHRSSGFNQLPQNQRHFLPQDSSHPSSRLHMEHFGHLGSGTDRMLLEVDEAHSLNTVEGKDRFHLNFDLVDSGALPLLLRLIRSSPSSLARALAILSICTELGANFSKPQLENLFIKSHILKNLSHLSSLSDERIRAYVCLAYSRLFHLEGNMVFLDDVDCRNPKLSETQPRRGKIMMANNASETVMDPSLEDQGNVLCNLIRLASTTKTRATRQHSLLCLKRYTSLYIKSGSAKSSLFESFAQRNSSHVTITQSTVAFDDTAARAITGILHLQMRHNRLYVDHRHLHAYFKPGGAFCTRASESSAQEKSDLFPFPSTVDLPSAVAVDDGSTLGADTANDHTSVCPSLPFNNAYNTLNILHNLTFRLGYHDKLVSASQCIPELILALDPLIEFVMSHSFVDKAEHHHAATRVSAGSRSSHQSTRESIFSSHDDAFFANFFPFTSPTPYTYSLRYYIAFFKQSRSLPHAKALSLSLRTGKERSRDLGGGGGGEATTVSPISMPVYMPPWLLALQSICNLVSGSKGSHSPVIEQGGLQKLVQILYDLLAIGEVLVVEEQERETEQGRGKAGENGTSEGEVEGRSELQTICLSNYKAVMRDPTQRGEEEEEAEEEGNLRQAVDWHRALILDSVCSAIRDLLINLPVEQAGMHVTLSRVERREERENLRTFGWGEGTLESGSSTGSDSAERRGEAEKHGIKDYERNYEHNHERGYEKRNDKKEGGARLDGKRKNVTAIDLDKEMEMRGENETICTPSSSSSLRTRIFVDLKGEKGELGQLRYIREHVWIGQALLRAVSGGAELRALRSSCCLDIMTGLATLSSKRDFAFGSHGCPTYLSLPCNALSVTVRFSQEPFLHLLHPQSLLSSQPPLGYAEAVREGCLQMEYAIKENKFRERGNTHGTRRGHRSKHQYRQSGATGSEVARPEVTLVSQSQHINSGSDVDETEDQDEGSVHVSKTNCTNPVYSSHFSELGGSTDRARFSSPHYSSRTERRRTEKTITKTNRKRSMQTAVLRRKSLVRTSFSSSSSFPPPSANTGVQQEDQNQNEYMKIERKACVSHHQSPSSSTISDIRRAFHQDEGNKAEIVDLSNVRLAEAEWESQKKKRKMRMGAALSDFRKVVNRRSKRVDTAADAKSSLPGDSLGQGSGPRIHKKRWMFDELASLRALIHRPRGVNDVDTRYLAFVILINMTQKSRWRDAASWKRVAGPSAVVQRRAQSCERAMLQSLLHALLCFSKDPAVVNLSLHSIAKLVSLQHNAACFVELHQVYKREPVSPSSALLPYLQQPAYARAVFKVYAAQLEAIRTLNTNADHINSIFTRLLPHLGKAFKAEERHNAGKAGETGAFREPSDGSLPLQDIACEVFEGYLQVFQSFSQENISSSDAQNGFNTDKGERVTDTALETASSDQATEPEDTLPNQEFYYEDFFLLPSSLNSDDVLIRSILSGKKHTEMLSSTRSEHGSTNNRLSTVLSTLSITEETETKEMLSVLYRLVQKTDYIGLVRSCTLIKQITDDVSRVYCLDATGGIQLFIDFLLDSDTRGHSQHFERLLYYASGAVSQRKRSALPSGGIQHPYAMPQALLKLLPADGSPPQFDHIVPRVQRGWEKGQTATSERQRRKDIRKILCLIADIFRNLIRRVDSHPAFIEAGGVECLVLLIHSEHLKVKQVAAATLAQVIPYASVQGNPGMEIIISALVMLLHLRYSDHLLYTAIQSINRLCVTERVKSYILSQTPILPVLLEMMPHVAEYVLVSVLDLFLALARHDPRAFNQVFIPMLGKVNKKSRQMAAVFFSFHRSNQPFHIQNQAFLLLCQICRNEMPNTTGGTTPSFRSADVFMTNEQTLRRTTDGVALNVSRETPASSNQSQGQSINSNTSSSSSCYQQRLAIFRRFGAEIGMLGLLIDRILMHTARSDLSLFARWMDILFFFLDDESVLADQEYSSAVTQLMHHLSQTAPLKITAADIQSSQESTRTALASHLSSKNTKKSWMWNSQLAGGTGGLDLSDLKACDARIIDNAKTVVVRMASHLCSDTMMSTENNIQSLSEAFSLKLDSTLPRRRGEGELELGSLLQSRIKDKRRHATSTELATLAPSLSTATTSQLLKSGKVDAKKATSRAPPFTTSTNSGTEADNKTVSDPEQTEGEELRLLELAQRFLISAGRTKSRDDSSVAPRDHNRHKKREKLDMARLVPNLDMHTQQNQTSGTRTAMARFEKQRKQNQARQEKYLEAQSKRKTWMQRKVNDGKKAWGQAPGKGERMEGEEEKRRLRSALNERKPLYPKPEGKLYDLSVLEKSREDVWIPPGKPRDTLLHGPDFSLDLDDLSDHLVGFDSNDSAFGGVNGSSDDSDEQPGLPRSLQRRLRDRRRRKKKKYAKEQ